MRPKPVVFICGGKLALAGPFKSMRDAIVRSRCIEDELPATTVLLAEKAIERFQTSRNFRDLVEFERLVAEIAEGVMLIVEGPGAIAELGFFSVISEIQSKLYVGVDSALHDRNSFISAGPLAYMESCDAGVVHGVAGVHRADETTPVNEVGAREVARGFVGFVKGQQRARLLSRGLKQDLFCLVYFCLYALRGCYLGQLVEAMMRLHSPLENQELRRMLTVMELVGWVRQRQLGTQICWFPVLDVNPLDAAFLPAVIERDVSRRLSDISHQVLQQDKRRAEEFLSICGVEHVAA